MSKAKGKKRPATKAKKTAPDNLSDAGVCDDDLNEDLIPPARAHHVLRGPDAYTARAPTNNANNNNSKFHNK